MDRLGVSRCLVLTDPPSGLRALLVIDDLTLGPAAGGIRTRRYDSLAEAGALVTVAVLDPARAARVPDFIASAGAVIEGIGASLLGLTDRTTLIDRIGMTTREVLRDAADGRRTSTDVAEARARARLAAGRNAR